MECDAAGCEVRPVVKRNGVSVARLDGALARAAVRMLHERARKEGSTLLARATRRGLARAVLGSHCGMPMALERGLEQVGTSDPRRGAG